MKKITYERIEKNDGDFLALAKALGYKERIIKNITKEVTVEEAREQGYYIQEVLADTSKCIAVVDKQEIENPETEVEFLEKQLENLVNNFVKQKMVEYHKQELEKEMQEKLQEAEKEIEEKL